MPATSEIIQVLITRRHTSGDLARYSYRFELPNGAACSDDYFSTVTDAEKAAQGSVNALGHVPQFYYSTGCFDA